MIMRVTLIMLLSALSIAPKLLPDVSHQKSIPEVVT